MPTCSTRFSIPAISALIIASSGRRGRQVPPPLADEISAAPGTRRRARCSPGAVVIPGCPPNGGSARLQRELREVLTLDFHSPAGPLRFFETITTLHRTG